MTIHRVEAMPDKLQKRKNKKPTQQSLADRIRDLRLQREKVAKSHTTWPKS